MKSIFAFTILFLAQSCSWLESDYDKLMNPIKAIKLSEKKAGKANPIFDGVREPDFPDEKLNNETLEGVDSNHDGVRDDIEIWINRTAEDSAIRLANKDLYRKQLVIIQAVQQNMNPSSVLEKWQSMLDVNRCLSVLYKPYNIEYLKRYTKNASIVNGEYLDMLFFNASKRHHLEQLWGRIHFDGVLEEGKDSYCSNTEYRSIFNERLMKFKKNN